MTRKVTAAIFAAVLALLPASFAVAATFGEEVEFLSKYVETIVLKSADGKRMVAVVPAYQGRVMTSSFSGYPGLSMGWINHELIASGAPVAHINPYGGEDRFWMGPEGGQFAIFFPKDAPFDLEHWQTPACIDTEPFEVVSKSDTEVVFTHTCTVTNWSGTEFKVKIDRTIRMIEKLDSDPTPELKNADGVAFESINTITNVGDAPWTKETGLLSIWILGMFNPSPSTTVIIPVFGGENEKLGPMVNDAYFGKVPAEKLLIKDNKVFFSGDGTYRSKIGISPKRAYENMGSYDAEHQILTVVYFNKPPRNLTDYVNSMWEKQESPFSGDAVNSYNDGPPAPDKKPLGPFYELETSSPAAALAPGQSITHKHNTAHFVGPPEALNFYAKYVFNSSIDEISNALKK